MYVIYRNQDSAIDLDYLPARRIAGGPIFAHPNIDLVNTVA